MKGITLSAEQLISNLVVALPGILILTLFVSVFNGAGVDTPADSSAHAASESQRPELNVAAAMEHLHARFSQPEHHLDDHRGHVSRAELVGAHDDMQHDATLDSVLAALVFSPAAFERLSNVSFQWHGPSEPTLDDLARFSDGAVQALANIRAGAEIFARFPADLQDTLWRYEKLQDAQLGHGDHRWRALLVTAPEPDRAIDLYRSLGTAPVLFDAGVRRAEIRAVLAHGGLRAIERYKAMLAVHAQLVADDARNRLALAVLSIREDPSHERFLRLSRKFRDPVEAAWIHIGPAETEARYVNQRFRRPELDWARVLVAWDTYTQQTRWLWEQMNRSRSWITNALLLAGDLSNPD